MRVALVSAPYDTNLFRIGENLGIKYLAAVLDEIRVTVDVFEPSLLGLDNETLTARLLAEPYDLIGFSIMFDSALPNVIDIVRRLRTEGCRAHLTAGGHVPSFNYVEILMAAPGMDSIVRFEGEHTLLELVDKLDSSDPWTSISGLAYRSNGQVVSNPLRPLIPNLDSLPFPRRDFTSRHLGDPHYFVISTRGCPFICTFCSIPAFYKTPQGSAWRARWINNVVDELKYLVNDWDATAISFLDDEFLVGRNGKRRAADLASELLQQQLELIWSFECRAEDVDEGLFKVLKEGGLRRTFVGIESGVQTVLDRFQKRTTVEQNRKAIEIIRGLDLGLAAGFIMYDPDTTIDEVRQNVNFLEEMALASYKGIANKVQVYRGTQLEADLASQGRLIRQGLLCDFEFRDPRVAQIHNLASTFLKPCNDVDTMCRRMEFALDNAGPPAASLNRLRTQYSDIQEEVNSSLCELTRTIITFVERFGNANATTVDRFQQELEDAVASYTRHQLRELRVLDSDLQELLHSAGAR